MSEKRRDSKNRILRSGESQRKDGRYVYKYTDATGRTQFIYSWKLEKTDKTPKGKRQDISLREKEKEIQKCLDEGIIINGGGYTVQDLVQKYINQKNNIKMSSLESYETRLNLIKNEPFGVKRIDKVKSSDAKQWFIDMDKNGKSYNYISCVKILLKAAFNMAIEDDLITKNPFNFKLNTIITNTTEKRKALSKAQEEAFLSFIKNNSRYKKYYDAIYILFNTGLRISEFCGLTKNDIDFIEKRITVDHQLVEKRDKTYAIIPTKTETGSRLVPMNDSVCECFKRIISNKKKQVVEPIIDGKSGFLFIKRTGVPRLNRDWELIFNDIMRAYNNDSSNKVEIPKITPHVCRHTFCTKMVLVGTSPKVLQYIMGHANIETTLNIYTHVQHEDVVNILDNEIAKIDNIFVS